MRNRLRCHGVILLRTAPADAKRLLPPGLSARTVGGVALLELVFARHTAGPIGWLPTGYAPTSDRLALQIAIEGANDRVVLLERGSSSWIRSHLGRHSGPSFDVEDTADAFQLSVNEGERRLLHVHAEPIANSHGSVFRSTREAADYFDPRNPTGSHNEGTFEALSVLELHSVWLDELGLETEVDSAYRHTLVRREATRSPSPTHASLSPPRAATYLPSV